MVDQTKMSRDTILKEVNSEREYQEQKWGNSTDDKMNSPLDYVGYIANLSTRWFPGGFPPYSEATLRHYRQAMIKTAALAIAAVEQLERGGFSRFEDKK